MGKTIFSIPKMYMGHTLQEHEVKKGLLEMNGELHFDMGACLNIWHPYRDSRQNIFYRGKSIVAMDRGTLPENAVWTVTKEIVTIPYSERRPGEIYLALTEGVLCYCHKCKGISQFPSRPVGVMVCPFGCENIGLSTDEKRFGWGNKPVDKVQVFRSVRDRVILVGWRHTLGKLMAAGVPRVHQKSIEIRFGINLEAKPEDDVEVSEDVEERILDRTVSLSA